MTFKMEWLVLERACVGKYDIVIKEMAPMELLQGHHQHVWKELEAGLVSFKDERRSFDIGMELVGRKQSG